MKTNKLSWKKQYSYLIRLVNRYPTYRRFFLFLVCFGISTLIFFFRNPDAFINPVFYTEDGQDYIGPIFTRGFWSTFFTTHRGYHTFGNILLSGLAVVINNIFRAGDILYLPQSIAIVSYMFYALVATLPVLLLSNKIRSHYLVALALISSFFPLNGSDYEVIGRISNVGYAFFYIAFVLVAYRIFCIRRSYFVFLIDFALFLCANTNPVVFLLIPTIYIQYAKSILIDKAEFNIVRKNPTFISAIILSISLLLQGVNVFLGGALDQQPGYLDSPFVYSNAIEMLIARSILYPIIHPIYAYFNDAITILFFAFLIVGFVLFSKKANYGLYALGFYALFTFTIMAAIFRPGLSEVFQDYQGIPGLWARFYYGQNLLAIFLIVLLFHDIASRIKLLASCRLLMLLMLAIFLVGWSGVSSYGNPSHPMRDIGNFEQTLIAALSERRFVNAFGILDSNGRFLEIPIYPTKTDHLWTIVIPRELAEKSVANQGPLMNSMSKCK